MLQSKICEPAYLQRLVLSRGLNARDWIATIVRIILHRITGIFPYDRLNIYRDHPDDYLKSKFNHWRQCSAETTHVPIETSKRNEDLENYIVSTAYNYNALSGSALLEGAGERGDEPQVLPENELSNFSSGHRAHTRKSLVTNQTKTSKVREDRKFLANICWICQYKKLYITSFSGRVS